MVRVVARKADAGTRVDGEVVADLDGALHRLDDEDDGDQAGEAFLREPSDVADKEAAEKEVSIDSKESLHLASVATSTMSMAASQSPIQMRKER